VNLAKKYGSEESSGFINGCLGRWSGLEGEGVLAAQILDGTATAKAIRAEVAERAAALKNARESRPAGCGFGGATIRRRKSYVAAKGQACRQLGWIPRRIGCRNPHQQEVEDIVRRLNDESVRARNPRSASDSEALDETAVLALIRPEKDVDGISRSGLGALITGERAFVSCTPLGIIEMLDRYYVPIAGRRAVVAGRASSSASSCPSSPSIDMQP